MNFPQVKTSDVRQGSALLLVLVVVMLLSFSCYSFVELMLVELEAAHGTSLHRQLKRVADSGISAAICEPFNSSIKSTALNARMDTVDTLGEVYNYTTLKTIDGSKLEAWSQGVSNESAKLNLNSLPLDDFTRKASRDRLLALPHMDKELADAILDWMDEDDEKSEFGAESSYYLSSDTTYAPRQSHLSALNELLQVRGVTAELLYGTDKEQGWVEYLTLDSREANYNREGERKIHINHENLELLFNQIQDRFGEEAARFVCAWRLAGNAFGTGAELAQDEQEDKEDKEDNEEQSKRLKERRISTAQERLQAQLGKNRPTRSSTPNSPSNGGATNKKVRGGIDLGRKPAYRMRSVYDLIDAKVRIDINGKDTVLESPWSTEKSAITELAVILEDQLSTSGEVVHWGRININEAPFEVLMSIPGLDKSLAEAIIRRRGCSGLSKGEQDLKNSVTWLVDEHLLDLKQLRLIAPFITTKGDVVSGVSIGFGSRRPIGFAVAFTVDRNARHRGVIRLRDIGPVPLPSHFEGEI